MEIAFSVAIFFLIIIIFELVYSLFSKSDTRSVSRVVERYSTGLEDDDEIDILYYRKFSDIKLFDMFLAAIPAVGRLDELLQQSGMKILAGMFILSSFTVAVLLFLFCALLNTALPLSIFIACGWLLLPHLYLLFKRKQRRSQFEVLFPDALNLMSYSLKAGHSIMTSFKMVSEEMADPIGEEFDRVVEEINFGRDIDSSLRNLSLRIDSAELNFFVTSVIIQRETGGNLVEMLQKIAEIIRRKFRFREKVKVLSAQGKLSAIVLVVLPFVAGSAIFAINREYIMVLVSDPLGSYAIGITLIMMGIGSFIMYRLVQLDM